MDTVNKRPIIGFFCNRLYEAYNYHCWQGVIKEAEDCDVNLITLCGNVLTSYTPYTLHSYKNSLFELGKSPVIDGLIVLTGALGYKVGKTGMSNFLKSFGDIPIVSLGSLIESYPSIVVDNYRGMYEMVSHFIEVHGSRRFAYLSGPELNQDFRERRKAFLDALMDHNIDFDENLAVTVDLDHTGGRSAVRILLDERKQSFDTLIGATDVVAIYAMKELCRRGIEVPQDVRVGGFDNITQGRCCEPKLTTVEQPIFEMGRFAVKSMKNLVKGHTLSFVEAVSTSLVVRESCGCRVYRDYSRAAGTNGTTPRLSRLVQLNELILAAFPLNYIYLEAAGVPCRELLGYFEDPGQWQKVLPSMCEAVSKGGQNLSLDQWYAFLDYLKPHLMGFYKKSEMKKKLADFFEEIVKCVSRKKMDLVISAKTELENSYILLSKVNEEIIAGFDEDYIREYIRKQLYDLEQDSCMAVLFREGSNGSQSMVFSASITDDRWQVDEGCLFDSNRFLPIDLANQKKRFSLVIEPLHFKNEIFGFMVFDVFRKNRFIFETLTSQIGSALKGAWILRELREYSHTLEERVNERTEKLHQVHQDLVKSAYMAGMTSHTVNTLHLAGNLLNSINVRISSLEEQVKKLGFERLEKVGRLLEEHKDDLPGFVVNDSRGSLLLNFVRELGADIPGKKDDLISEFKDIRKRLNEIEGLTSVPEQVLAARTFREDIDLHKELEDILVFFRGDISRNHINLSVEKETSGPLDVGGQKVKVIHVITSVLNNSIEALLDKSESRRILIETGRAADGMAFLAVRDNGAGVVKENLETIFQYGFTTKENHIGAGLHNSANFMNEMGGRMTFNSAGTGEGARIVLYFKMKSG